MELLYYTYHIMVGLGTIFILVMAVAATHDVSAAQFYCLDFGGGALSSLRHVPHVGSVA